MEEIRNLSLLYVPSKKGMKFFMKDFFKNKKNIIIVAIVFFIILILVVLSTKSKKTKNRTNNIIGNNVTREETVVEKEEIEIEENENDYIYIDNNNQGEIVNSIPGNDRLKQALLNENWITNNLYLKKDSFGETISSKFKQKLSFIKIDNEGFTSPIVVVKVECDDANSNGCYVVTCDYGEIKVNSVSEKATHIGHVEYMVNLSANVLYAKTNYSGSEQYDIFNITGSGISKVCTIIKEDQYLNGKIEYSYSYNGNASTKEQYEQIQKRYVNEMLVKEEFLELNANTIKQNF